VSSETPPPLYNNFPPPISKKTDMKRTVIKFLLLACCATSLVGCKSAKTTYKPLPVSQEVNPQQEDRGFSDEESRDLIRQTRQLLNLKEQDYLVGPDDILELIIFEWQQADVNDRLELRVSKTGMIAMPGLGPIRVGGQTVEQIQTMVVDQLLQKGLLRGAPRVSVVIKEFRSRRISVVGAVNAPGVYALTENVASLLEILSLAGGPSSASGNTAFILREQDGGEAPLRMNVDLDSLYKTGAPELDAVLTDGDTVYIPNAPHVYVYGAVRSPGKVNIRRSLTVMEAIAESGGLTTDAYKDQVRVERKAEGNKRAQTFYINVARIEDGKSKDLFLQERDVVKISENDSKKFLMSTLDFIRGIFTASYRLDG